eukprot:1999918-Rhodomonas_salina.1
MAELANYCLSPSTTTCRDPRRIHGKPLTRLPTQSYSPGAVTQRPGGRNGSLLFAGHELHVLLARHYPGPTVPGAESSMKHEVTHTVRERERSSSLPPLLHYPTTSLPDSIAEMGERGSRGGVKGLEREWRQGRGLKESRGRVEG